jgi:hypothetical protein
MIGGWHDDVFSAINMTEGRILADLFDELGAPARRITSCGRPGWPRATAIATRQPWANGHGSRLSEEEYTARADDLAHNEGRERFHFDPRLEWPEGES